jgi:hypothetical protein
VSHKHHAHKVKHHKHRSRERDVDVSDSVCVDQASYDPRSKELTVTYINGGQTYVYDDIGRGLAKDFEDDPGVTLNDEII